MNNRKYKIIVFLNVVALFFYSCKTEEIILHGDVSGYVTDAQSDQPLDNAHLSINLVNERASTDSNGKYLFKNLKPDVYKIEVSRNKYERDSKDVTVASGSTASLDFALNKVQYIELSDTYLDFGFDETVKSFTISNIGGGKLQYSLTTSQDWITINPVTGETTIEADTIKVFINRSGLSEKKHIESVEIIYKSGLDIIRDTVKILLNGIWDQDKNYYGTVSIGTQTWLAENLNTGTMILHLYEPANNSSIEKYCYDNGLEYCEKYGGMYTWNEMMNYNPSDTGYIGTTRGICPEGWHIPTEWEWGILFGYLGDSAAAKLKEAGTRHWQSPNIATNESGFTALPGGEMGRDPEVSTDPSKNKFSGLGIFFNFWSSRLGYFPWADPIYWYATEFWATNISCCKPPGQGGGISGAKKPRYFAESVRCIKDP